MTQYHNIFDSHSHYDAEQFDGEREALLADLPQRGIRAVMAAADTLESAARGRKMAERYDYIWCSAGIHPHDAKSAPDNLEARLDELFQYEKCKAVGEIGLDYHYDHSPREKQREVFERHLAYAVKHDLPVIIHDREAHRNVMDLLVKYRPRGVVHCYSGSAEMAKELLKLGLFIGFTGAVTFKNARRAIEALAVIPTDRLLIETDCPYMAPVPLRGQRCDSSMIPHTAAVMAQAKGLEVQQLLDATFENACRVYGISPK
ncbi:TatD family hydrolase [Ruminococcaceae bacterium OttesenSCG-928-L11]|nr:TatD family hydrolase [Ruminococcaceae bacterium OttesenSCG-928-L11]